MIHQLLPLLLLSASPVSLGADSEPVQALIISGANNHDWRYTTPVFKTILEESGLFEVTITYEPGKDMAQPDYLKQFGVLLLDYNGPRWGDAAEAAFLKAVHDGVGVSVIHAANNAFNGWTEYEQLVGHLWRKGTGHGRFHDFGMKIRDRKHPITSTLPDFYQHPDELYHRLVRVEGPERIVLASSHSSVESGGTGEAEPMIIIGHYGEGRVFHTPLGHVWINVKPTRASLADPQLRNLIVRGTEWAATGEVTDGLDHPNHLTAEQAREGWRLLFDGQTTTGWRAWSRDAFPDKGWEVKNGCLRHTKGGGDIITVDTYKDFELAFEWKTARGVNSGVKYRVPHRKGGAIGPEYQILDDPGTEEDNNPLSAAAALYAILPTGEKQLAHAGAFNHSRIVCDGNRVQHWLNGELVLETEVGSEDFEARRKASKFRGHPEFATSAPGHILFQDHGGEVWYRSIRIRELTDQNAWQNLLEGDGLQGWKVVGGATFERDGTSVVGHVGDGLPSNSFLVREETYGDFEFEADLRVEESGNSGIQFRSKLRDDGVVSGYQAEIDCSKRAWSGGIFEEGGRGWLKNLKENPAGSEAFRLDEWNHYRIRANGDQLRVWVNGVPTARLQDSGAAEGFIALQVHGGAKGRFRWRAPRIRSLLP